MATIPNSGSDPATVSLLADELVSESRLVDLDISADGQESRLCDAHPIPDRFGKYRVKRLLGRGGFGEVYLARDEALARSVAIKVARPELWKAGEEKLFVEEARRLARLDHPGIVRVYPIDSHARLTYIVSEYVDGEDLRSWARRCNPDPEKIATLLAALSDAVAFAHSRGIWHRDIKPSNVLIDRAGSPKLIDFGLATDEIAQRTLAGENAGTLPYMSPEQVNGEAHRLDGRSDIWSVGVLLYELLSGSRPFGGDSASGLCDEIRRREPRPLRMIAPRTPPELARICMCCLAKRAIDRYQSAYDLTDDLRDWLKTRSDDALAESSRRAVLRTSGDPHAAILPKGFHSFDEDDADFFLDLLPGPREREGLPQRIRFWRTRIQERRPSETFAVGVMYGPSGCGKSSLIKAGLLPRLGHDVIPIYVEASGTDTEVRLADSIRRQRPETSGARLLDLLAQLRRSGGSGGSKTLIVLDQFEQWLHAQVDLEGSELVRALRQCDGGTVQCLVLVRDDFWMPVSRFMRALAVAAPVRRIRRSSESWRWRSYADRRSEIFRSISNPY